MAGLFQRMKAIFSAKADKALDKLEDPRETLDYSYTKQLELLQQVRRGVAEVATSRKRVELQAGQLNAQLDKLQVALPHPEAAAAIIKGGTEITGHFGNPPFQEQELAGNPKARIVLNSYDVQGGPASSTVLYATEKYKNESPKTYRAFLDALHEAAQFAQKNPEQAADIYLKVTGGKQDRQLVLDVIRSPQVQFTVQPQRTLALGQFLHRVGAIKNAPAQLGDYFFDDPRVAGGN